MAGCSCRGCAATDEQFAEFAAECGYPGGIPRGLPVLISSRTPAPARSYASITEVSCRFQTGYVVLREIGGRVLDLPPLPAGYGDYRLRFHVGEAGCLLQIWPQPRGKPRTRV
jgi:hypothetical protein